MRHISCRGRRLGGAAGAVLGLFLPLLAAAVEPPRFRVAGTNASHEILVQQSAERFEHTLRIELLPVPPGDGGMAESTLEGGVTVLVDPLLSAQGAQVPLMAEVVGLGEAGSTAPISLREPVQVRLTASLPAMGDYTGQLVLVSGTSREAVRLKVSRVQPAATVQFVQPGIALGQVGEEVEVRLALKETSGRREQVSQPRLMQLDRKFASAATSLVQATATEQFRWKGAALPDGGIPVAAHGEEVLMLSLEGLEHPGEYTGTVRIHLEHGAPVEQSFTVWVRSSMGWGAFFIFLGALASLLLRVYAQNLRPRLLQRERARAALARLQELKPAQPSSRVEAVYEALRRQGAELVQKIEKPLKGLLVNDTQLELFENRLRLFEAWTLLRSQVEALPQEVRPQDAEAKLAAVEKLLQDPEATEAQLEEQAQALKALDVGALARASLEARHQELRKTVDDLIAARGQDALSWRLTDELRPLLARVKKQLDEKKLEEAQRGFESARQSLLDILLAELEGSLSQGKPPGFTKGGWTKQAELIRGMIQRARTLQPMHLDEAFTQYQFAYVSHLRTLVVKLQELLTAVMNDATEEQQTELKSSSAHLKLALEHLSSDKPHEAAKVYGTESARYVALRAKLTVTSQEAQEMLSGTETAEPPATNAPAGGSVPPAAGAEPTSAGLDLDLLPLPRGFNLLVTEGLMFLALTVVAVLIGLQTLDVYSPTWGGVSASAVAFLWGFGVHQIGGATFEGLLGLRAKVGR